MKIPHMSKTAKIVVVVFVLFLGAVAFWFIRRGLQPGVEMTPQDHQVAPPPPQATPEEKLMGKVRIEMERVLTKWSEVEGPYEDDAKLRDLWMRRFPTTPKYRWTGINRLITHIRENELFGKCKPPHIKKGAFVEGGAIQKVGDLNNYLNPCEPQN